MNGYFKEWRFKGTEDELAFRIRTPFYNQKQKSLLINRLIVDSGISASYRLHEELRNHFAHFSKKVDLNGLQTIACGYIANAGDSIILRLSDNSVNYSAKLSIKLKYSDGIIRFDVKDNGKGIDSEVKSYLFSESQWSTKNKLSNNLEGVLFGCCGYSLKSAKETALKLGGSVGYNDQSEDKGAIFWYEFPLKSVISSTVEPVLMDQYFKKLMINF